MKPILRSIVVLVLMWVLVSVAAAGPRRVVVPSRARSGVTFFPGAGTNRTIVQGYPYFYQVPGYYYQPNYPSVMVVSPYAPSYILPPTVEVNLPYFCLLHNEGFVTRIALVDHLAGTHKIPLDAAAGLCPDAGGSCVYPSY